MSGKYDSSALLDKMRAELEARAVSFQRVCDAASVFEHAANEYAKAFDAALNDGWLRKDLSHLPPVPKVRYAEDGE